MEGVSGIAAVGGGVGERTDDVLELGDGAGPAVGDQQGQGVLVGRADVEQVDVEGAQPSTLTGVTTWGKRLRRASRSRQS